MVGNILSTKNRINLHLIAPLYFIGVVLLYLFVLVCTEFYTDENLLFGFCLSENCLDFLNRRFERTLAIFDWVLKVGAIWFALSSLVLGIRTFELAQRNSVTNNHINNFKSFCDYINSEIKNFKYLKKNKIDLYKLYDLVFPKSKVGELTEFTDYEKVVKNLRNQLIESSKIFKRKTSGSISVFDYEKHQLNLIKVVEKLGVELSHLHRNDFYFIEDDIIKFIDMVTKTFTTIGDKPILLQTINRHYR